MHSLYGAENYVKKDETERIAANNKRMRKTDRKRNLILLSNVDRGIESTTSQLHIRNDKAHH
jgi:hypothetical protein